MTTPKKLLHDAKEPSEPQTTYVLITPAMAAEWIETASRVNNRSISQAKVEKYTAAMRAGQWKITHQGIAFDTNGDLRDGQHRLWAIIESNQAVTMAVTTDMSVEAFDVIDTGKARNATDVLSIHGERRSQLLAGALAWQFRLEKGFLARGTMLRNSDPTPIERLEVLDRNPKIRDSVSIYDSFQGSYRKLIPASLLIWLHYHLSQAGPTKVGEFFDTLRLGANLSPDNALFLLRDRLIANMQTTRRLPEIEVAALTIKAWNYWLSGEKRQVLVWTTREAFPTPSQVLVS